MVAFQFSSETPAFQQRWEGVGYRAVVYYWYGHVADIRMALQVEETLVVAAARFASQFQILDAKDRVLALVILRGKFRRVLAAAATENRISFR